MSRRVRRIVFAALAAFVVYPLSYAPVSRILYGPDDPRVFETMHRAELIYLPLHIVIDHTWADVPLRLWARLWEVDTRFDIDSVWRQTVPGKREMQRQLRFFSDRATRPETE